MLKEDILKQIIMISRESFLVFLSTYNKKLDNSLEALKIIAKEKKVTAGYISEALDIRPSSVTQIIKKLEALGMIRREKSQKDARVTLIILTEKGENSLYFQDKATKSLIDIMFDNFTEEELQAFQVYLDKLGNNLTSPDFLENIQDIFELENNWSTFSSRGAQFNKIREKLFTHESPQKYQFSDRLNQEKFNYRDFSRDIFDSFEKDFKGEK